MRVHKCVRVWTISSHVSEGQCGAARVGVLLDDRAFGQRTPGLTVPCHAHVSRSHLPTTGALATAFSETCTILRARARRPVSSTCDLINPFRSSVTEPVFGCHCFIQAVLTGLCSDSAARSDEKTTGYGPSPRAVNNSVHRQHSFRSGTEPHYTVAKFDVRPGAN